MKSNRYNNPAISTEFKSTSEAVCPVCGCTTHAEDGEMGYHGKNGGAYLCDGSGLVVRPRALSPMTPEAHAYLEVSPGATFLAVADRYGLDAAGPSDSGSFIVNTAAGAFLFSAFQGPERFRVRISMRTVWTALNLSYFGAVL